MAAIPNFEKFRVHGEEQNAGTRWRKYIARFEIMVTAMGLNNSARKKALLLHVSGDEVFDIVQTFTDEQKGDDTEDGYKALKKSLSDYLEPKKSVDFETFKFRQEKQAADESVDSFCTRLRQLGSTCEFANLDREIKAQILQGCTSNRLRRRALQEDMNLEALLKLARSLELADVQAKEMETAETANFMKRGTNVKTQGQKASGTNKKTCGWCGSKDRHAKRDCPAKDKKCRACGKIGHYAAVCRSNQGREAQNREPQSRRVRQVTQDSGATSCPDAALESDDDYCFGVGKTPTVDLTVNKKTVKFFIDTGASVNIIDGETAQKLSLQPEPTQAKIYAYGSTTPLVIAGRATATVEHKTQVKKETFFVVKSHLGGNLLSSSTAQNLGLIQFAYSCQHHIPDSYPDLFEGIGKMKDMKVKLHIDPEVKPVCQPHRRIPFHLRKKVEQELKRLEDLDIIEKVDGPTPWVSPIVAAPKPKSPDEIRICVDMRLPNQAIKRTRHIMPTVDDILMQLNQAKVFSKLDLNSGYHQLELDEDSRNITTFTTHAGLRRYKRLNFGVTSAAEMFQNVIAETLSDIPDALNTSDDILIHGRDQEEHDRTLIRVLDRMREKGLTLNKRKCEFNKETIEFYGFIFGKDGVSPDAKKIDAIKKMPRPTTPKEVRSFLGMTNYISRFILQYADVTKPLRDLTRKGIEWKWTKDQEDAFNKLKDQVTNPQTMAYFDDKSKTEIIVDASPVGLGAILVQEDKRGQRKVIAYASRALTDVETRYSQTEREALAVVWACEHFHLYLFGQTFTVISDHKPLEGIFNRPTSHTNARIERWNIRLQSYSFVLKYRPGDENPADFLSRHPMTSANTKTAHETKVAEEYINFITEHSIPKAMTSEEISKMSAADPTLRAVKTALQTNQWQTPKDFSVDITAFLIFKTVRDELSLCDNSEVILRGDKIVIPQALQHRVVNIAHEGHQGLVKTKSLLREKIWFPQMDKFVDAKIKSCLPCAAATPSNHTEPLHMSPLPSSPWKEVSVDFCGPFPSGDYLLVVVDDYSRYPEVEVMSTTSAKSTIPKLDAIFARHGIPEVVKSDNGPPFNSQDFRNFASYSGFHHRKITPLWPQANGGAERMMATLKKAIQTAHMEKKAWKQELYSFLRNYRATPHSTTGVSPAEALFKRKLRTRLPETSASDLQDHQDLKIRLKDKEGKTKMKAAADDSRNSSYPDIKLGDNVLVKQPKENKLTTPFSPEPMTVTARQGSMVTASNARRSITRNSSHFKKIPEVMTTPASRSPGTPVPRDKLDAEPSFKTPLAAATPAVHASGTVPPAAVRAPRTVPDTPQLMLPGDVPVARKPPPAAQALPPGSEGSPASVPVRRSGRTKQPPSQFKDYIR